jgi:hypothetical protein
MSASLFNKTAEEAIEALANRYIEVQIKKAKDDGNSQPAASKTDNNQSGSGMSSNTANAIIGGLAGAGIGGLGSLGYNYLKGKGLRAKDVLYGALMGAVPGASLGYLAGGSEDSSGGTAAGAGLGDKLYDAANLTALPIGAYAFAPGARLIKGTPKPVLDLSEKLNEAIKTNASSRHISNIKAKLDAATASAKANPSIADNLITIGNKSISAPKVRTAYRGGLGIIGAIPLFKYLTNRQDQNSDNSK